MKTGSGYAAGVAAAVLLVAAGGCSSWGSSGSEASMNLSERTGVVTARGNPVTLLGPDVTVGSKAPDFKVVDGSFQPVTLADFKGKAVLISAVPSLDTSVCSLQTKRFNDEADKLPENVAVLTISQDLPFAQTRFCSVENVKKIQVLSDHVWRDFGQKYGVLIKENALLARSIWVIAPDGRIVYRQIVPELSSHPDYEKALAAVKAAAGEKG